MVNVYSIQDVEWDQVLNKLPENKQDIYFTREYYKIHEMNGDGIACCFVYTENNQIAVYPFMKNKIDNYDLDKDYYDIETVYGYGGPIVSHENIAFLQAFESSFMEYCETNNIVAEFVRFHPIIGNELTFTNRMNTYENRNTVYLDLNKDIENIWLEEISSKKNRNMIRKGLKKTN